MSNIRLPPPSETPPPPYQAESDPISQGSPSSPPTSGTNRDREESSVSLSRMIGEESEDRHSEDLPPYPHPTVQQWSPANIAVTHRSRGAASVHRYEPLTRYEMIENAAIPVDLTSQATNLQTDQLHNTLNLGCHVTCMSFTTITKIRQYYYNSREPAFFTDSSVPLDELAESARTRWNNDSADLIWYQSHDWACAVCDRPAGGMIPHVQDYNHPEEDSDQVRWNICTPVCDNNGDCRTEADEWTRDCRDWANKMMRDRKRCANCSKRLGIPMIPCSKCWLVGYVFFSALVVEYVLK